MGQIDVYHTPGSDWTIVLQEFFPFGTLETQMPFWINLPENFILSILTQLLNALAFSHSKGIHHGNINPQNVYISEDCKV